MQNELENISWQNEFPTLAKMPKETPFCVPDNYFETLNENIKTKILLSDIKEKDFSVPDNYFENLQAQIIAKTAVKKESNFNYFKIMKYAAAASVVLIVATSVWLVQNKSKQVNNLTTVEQQREQLLYELDEMAILDEINTSKQIKKVDTDDMEAYILHNYTVNDIAQEYKNK